MGSAPDTHRVTLKYFAWVREKAGRAEETVALPSDVSTVGDLLRWQMSRGHPFDLAFANAGVVRVALDRVHVKPEASIEGAREIAFFPPMTGG